MSVKPAPVIAAALALLMLTLSTVLPPIAMLLGVKVFAAVGDVITVRLTGPAPAPALGVCVVVTPLTLLGLLPRLVLVTWIVTLQPPGAKLGTVRLSAVAPTASAGLLVTPAQVPPMVVEATLMLTSVSLKFALLRMPVFALPRLNVIVLMSPLPMLDGLNDLAMVGVVSGGAVTIKFAEAVAPELALVDVSVPVVLVMPGAAAVSVLVTWTLMLQLPVPPALNGTVAALMPNDASFATLPDVTVPPQVLLKPGVEKTFMPAGKMSLNAAPVIACAVDGLTSVNVMVVALLATMVAGLKLLVSVGAAKRTDNGALAAMVLPPPLLVLRKPAVGDAGMVLV